MKFNIIHPLLKFMVGVMAIVVIAACTHEHKYKIGVSQCSADDWRTKMNEEILREAMLHENVDIEILSADDSNAKQIADLDHFIDNGFDIIIVAPNEADALTPKIKEIYESGIPVIIFDRNIHGDTYTAFQGADNEQIGKMAASFASTLVAQPHIIEIKGREGSTPAELRRAGFHNAADSLGYKILGEAVGNWNYDDAKVATDSLLALYPVVNLIYAHNDRMAIAAREVTAAYGRNDIRIIGIDAAPSIGIQAVKDGVIDATFLYPTYGNQLLKTALDILEGRGYERVLMLPTATPVDRSNAEILLLQDRALKAETEKIGFLQGKMADFSKRYATQATILYGAIIILLLLAAMIFLLLRYYWSSKRHHQLMRERNSELARQRDKLSKQRDELSRQRDELDSLYHQLEEATGSKLAWFTNVSHDLRTPLTLIADPVHQIAAADNLTPEQHTRMQLADKNVKRLQRLVNQILDIRKYDNQQLRMSLNNINLSESVKGWVASFADLAVKRHINLVSEISDNEIITAVDVEKTERIFFNLLSNAFKFTPENGTITVTLNRDGDNAVMRVADTGRGIPEEDIPQIFDRFFRTETVNPNGSGIGLALSKVFIEMQGGNIDVQSRVGEGSVFTVTLPIHLVEGQDTTTAASTIDTDEIDETESDELETPEVAEDTPAVLVIDDNADICTLVKSILSTDYTVITANSGARGIRLANKLLPDLILCDVMMPGTDGYQVCRALKSDPLTAHIPVLLLTACSRDEQRIEGYECGADAYMSKPFDSAMLLARCKSLIANRRLIYQNFDAKQSVADRPSAKTAQANAAVEDEFLRRFIEYVETNIADAQLSVESIADALGISRVQLYRKIKSTTNYTAAEMIRNIRLKRAAKMLKTTDTTVSEVAYAVGFSSPGYFSRCYKEYFNETPVDTQNRTSKKH